MSKLATNGHAATAMPAKGLPTGAWDFASFLQNAKDYASIIGGSLVGLIGLLLCIVSVVYLAQKLWGSQQSQSKGWATIIVMFLIGGALLTGGLTFVLGIAAGGQKTITDLGGGVILPTELLGLLH